jgi:hypothetical protein
MSDVGKQEKGGNDEPNPGGGSAKELIKLVVGSYPDPDHDLSTTLSDGSVLFVNSD